MKNDFISIYKTIESTEQQGFRQYIQYFYGQQKTVLNIFDQVVQVIETNEEQQFSTSASKNKKIQNDLSDLKKWLLEFLTIQEVKNGSYEAKFLTLKALHKRGLKGSFDQKVKQLNRELTEHPSPDMWMMLWRLRLTHIQYFDTEIDRLQISQSEMEQLLDDLDSFYMSTKLKYCTELQNRTDVLGEKYPNYHLNDILNKAEQGEITHPVIKTLYIPILKLIKDKSEAAFLTLTAFIKKEQGHDRIEKLSVLLYLLNFAINKIRKGDASYCEVYLDLTEMGLKQKLFIAWGDFPTETFTNIVNLGSHLGKINWVKNFIHVWSPYLEPNNRLVTENLALARIYFEERKFDEVVLALQKVPYKSLVINLNARVLLVRAYYELNEPKDLILDFCNALYLYVYRSTSIGAEMKISTQNFIRILRSLVYKKPKDQLIKELESIEGPILCYQWLKSKI